MSERLRSSKVAVVALLSRRWMIFERQEVKFELELELIQTQMAQKPLLRVEVCALALRARQYKNCLRLELFGP
jgi:hypothetical protein